MKYATVKLNDIANAPGVCVSVYLQGCPHHCPKCFNPETWDFDGGKPFTEDTMNTILKGLTANGIKRNLCILGGEPLCAQNASTTLYIIQKTLEYNPDIKIYIWTGYVYENLLSNPPHKDVITSLNMAHYLIDGPYVNELRDLRLKMRGSSNQRIINLKTGEIEK